MVDDSNFKYDLPIEVIGDDNQFLEVMFIDGTIEITIYYNKPDSCGCCHSFEEATITVNQEDFSTFVNELVERLSK